MPAPHGQHDDLDAAFARFCATGDPAALGSVFDGTAAELLRLAHHLVGDLALAEDLVQATFLAAIESRGSFEPGRPVRPWLTGILTNRAHLQRRSRDREPDPARLPSTCPLPDPPAAAAVQELSQAVSDAIAALPDPYRPVLLLHLRHGLAPLDIALTLGRAPGTVRKQLARGLDRLRRALPAGFAATLALSILPARGLAAVREAVLGSAEFAMSGSAATAAGTTGAAATLAAATTTGVLLMKKAVWITVAVSAIAATAFWAMPEAAGGGANGLPEQREGVGRRAGRGDRIGADNAPQPPSPESAALTAPDVRRTLVVPTGDERERLATLRGRCVDRGTGLPLAGCSVQFHGWVGQNEKLEAYVIKHGDVQWENPPPLVTGSDGRFEFRFVPPPPHVFGLHIAKPGLVKKSGHWLGFRAGEVKDLGDIDLRPGTLVIGSIVDPESQPLARRSLDISLSREGRVRRGEMREDASLAVRSGEDGSFVARTAIGPGVWKPSAGPDTRVEPTRFTVAAGQDRIRIDFVLEEPPPVEDFITGRVIDAAGVPVAGAEVSVVNAYGIHLGVVTGRTLSGRDGAFRLGRQADWPADPPRLGVTGAGLETLVSDARHPWGSDQVELVVQRGLAVEIRVVDGTSGKAIEEFGVRCFRDPAAEYSNHRRDFSLRELGRHPDGRLVITGILRGPQVVLVEPRGNKHLPSGLHRFTVTDQGAPTQTIALYRPVARPLLVVAGDGSVVAGTQVELLEPLGSDPVGLETRTFGRTDSSQYWGDARRAVLIFSGHTDAAGTLVLTGRPGQPFALRLLGPGHQPTVVDAVVLDPELGTLRVEVAPGATLVGRLSPLGLVRQFEVPLQRIEELGMDESRAERYQPHIRLRRLGDEADWFPTDNLARAVVTGDGRFEMAGIPPGDWEVLLHSHALHRHGSGSPVHILTTREPLTQVRGLASGETRELDLDIAHLELGRLSGTILVNGEPLPTDSVFSLFGSKPDGRGGSRSSASLQGRKANGQGVFSLPVHPGSYRLTVQLPDDADGGAAVLHAAETALVAAGQSVERVFQLHHRPLRLRVLAGDGKTPVAGVAILAYPTIGQHAWRPLPKTDANGSVVMPRMECGTWRFEVFPERLSDPVVRARLSREDQAAARIVLGTRELPPGAEEVVYEIVLPASAGY